MVLVQSPFLCRGKRQLFTCVHCQLSYTDTVLKLRRSVISCSTCRISLAFTASGKKKKKKKKKEEEEEKKKKRGKEKRALLENRASRRGIHTLPGWRQRRSQTVNVLDGKDVCRAAVSKTRPAVYVRFGGVCSLRENYACPKKPEEKETMCPIAHLWQPGVFGKQELESKHVAEIASESAASFRYYG